MVNFRLLAVTCFWFGSLYTSHTPFRYDPTNPQGFQNFRATNQLANMDKAKINVRGLATLTASASGQLDEAEFKALRKQIKTSRPILVIDLRQETHGIINGRPVYVKSPEATVQADIKALEESIFTNSKKKGATATFHQRELKSRTREVIKVLKTEEEVCASCGLQYLRIPIVDHKVPSTAQIDLFVELVDQLENTWIHVHCRKGLGRSTTFMSIYDILKNGHVASLNEILRRQRALGGAHLTHEKSYGEHHRLLKEFYQFAKAHRAGHAPRWSEWKRRRR